MRPKPRALRCNCVFCAKVPDSLNTRMDCEVELNSHPDHAAAALAFPPKTFKQTRNYASRQQEVANIRNKFPNKIPVVVERYAKETTLPVLDKTKFLVPQELTMSQFVTILRNRMQLQSTMSFYLLVNNRSLVSLSRPLSEVYRECRDDDGFLYVTYASQEVFG
ncbi:microtubule-associated proteins 1A/1B light chain 3C-like isoform X1 [Portunus trituberculatus]|uniref:microtubule-associated proteins 1A/1B light chain 3C-like isoform X1 n=1 Tax=Portunus trituberculatus TaxID=210409 RepID=UPI001E1CD4A7|nr:microtubule-associated proteins 1A/1B light chain 3C-like isoform X1 [Portunus trituberculatus]